MPETKGDLLKNWKPILFYTKSFCFMNFKFVCFGEVLFDVLPTEVKLAVHP